MQVRCVCKSDFGWVVGVKPAPVIPPRYGASIIVSPLATLAFGLCVVGDTGLKTGWVRCRHGAGRDGAGWLLTYFAERISTMVQTLLLSQRTFYFQG